MSWQTPESDEERAEREERERVLQEERDRLLAEREVMRTKAHLNQEMRNALDRYSRVMRWKTETYSRPSDYTDAKYEEELEIAAWQIQGLGEQMREVMPEFFWPKGTPVTGRSGVYVKPERLKALKMDLEATAESIDELLTDTVEEEDDD